MSADRIVSVERLVPAARQEVFDLLADPARHVDLDGSGTVVGRPRGPERLHEGASFSMRMRQAGQDYRTTNDVIEFEEGRRIAWRTTGTVGGRTIGGQVWRYLLSDAPAGAGTLVRQEYDWRAANTRWWLVLLRFPQRTRRSMAATLDRLSELLVGG